MSSLSLADLVGTALYIVTACASIWAGTKDRKRSRTPDAAFVHWCAVAALFFGAAAWRLLNGEGRVQEMLREGLRAGGEYDDRYTMQGPIAAALVAMLAIVGATAAWRWFTQPPHRAWSMAGALGLLGFSMIRLVSYHPIDRLIYSGVGPLRLNYLIELALIGSVFYGIFLLVSSKRHVRRPSRGHR